MGVGCPCPPVRNDIVTPRRLLKSQRNKIWKMANRSPTAFLRLSSRVEIGMPPKREIDLANLDSFVREFLCSL